MPKCQDNRSEDDQTHVPDPPLGLALMRVVRAVMFEEEPVQELNELPLAQLRLLWTVHYVADATMKLFSERLGVSQSTVSQLADRLVRRGLVERHDDTDDRRVVRLRTTAYGREVLTRAEEQQRHTLKVIWDGLSEQERNDVLRGLEILGSAAEAMRAALGRPVLPWDIRNGSAVGENHEVGASQPVVDLMARRVRGVHAES